MLLLTLFLSFTGYLLPWDQLAYWAVTVGTNIASSIPVVGPTVRELLLGGRAIDQPTLIRFYVLHVHRAAGRARRAVRVPHVARAQGRRARARRPRRRASRRPPRRRRSRPRPTRCSASRAARPRRSRRARSTTRTPPSTAVPDLTRRAAIVMLGTIAVLSILAVLDALAARGGRQRAGHAEPGQGAVVLPLAAGNRHRHHDSPRQLHDQRRVRRRRDPAGPPRRRC